MRISGSIVIVTKRYEKGEHDLIGSVNRIIVSHGEGDVKQSNDFRVSLKGL